MLVTSNFSFSHHGQISVVTCIVIQSQVLSDLCCHLHCHTKSSIVRSLLSPALLYKIKHGRSLVTCIVIQSQVLSDLCCHLHCHTKSGKDRPLVTCIVIQSQVKTDLCCRLHCHRKSSIVRSLLSPALSYKVR